MKIGIVVDAACDLPRDFIDEQRISILPVALKVGGHTVTDNRDPAVMQMFYREHYGQRGEDAETAPYSAEQIRDLFLHRLVLEYDQVFLLTIAATRSPIHAHAEGAALALREAYKPVRRNAGLAGTFALRVVDTQNLFAGQAVVAVEAARLIAAGEGVAAIGERLEYLARRTYGYMLPRDLHFLGSRARKKGDVSVGWLSAVVGSALDLRPVLRAHRGETAPVARLRGFEDGAAKLFAFLVQRIEAGLIAPTLCLSYGGDLRDLEALPGYGELQRHCRAHKVEVLACMMSMTGAINVGEGALAAGFVAEPHEFS